jgi:hypothetical protein
MVYALYIKCLFFNGNSIFFRDIIYFLLSLSDRTLNIPPNFYCVCSVRLLLISVAFVVVVDVEVINC